MIAREYTIADRLNVFRLFIDMLQANKSYISHGEIQMGLSYDGQTLAPDAEEKWQRYFERQHSDSQSFIYVCEDKAELIGFTIFGIENDYDKDYGIIYDILVKDEYKGTGAATTLFQCAIEQLKSAGISDCYLESGIDNHRAHAFFKKKGFKHISNIYRFANI